jgi:hypothetical protein
LRPQDDSNGLNIERQLIFSDFRHVYAASFLRRFRFSLFFAYATRQATPALINIEAIIDIFTLSPLLIRWILR